MDIVNDLTVGISTGTYAPGELLPTQDAIRAMYVKEDGTTVSRAAVINAFDILADRGLVTKIRGKGVRVTTQIPHKSGFARALSVRRTGRIYEPGEYAVIKAAELAAAPPDVAIGLGVEPGSQVIRRHRVTHNANGTIESASTSWYDGALADVAPLLLSTERIPEGSWAYLESQTGRRAVRGKEKVKARMAAREEAEELLVIPPVAVKVSTLFLYDPDGGVIEYGVSIAATEREAEYEFDLPS